jgi:alpha-tubulin suppressor-like RCC1 family protein
MVHSGRKHTCGVTTAAKAYCWGTAWSGELGDGTTTFSSVPVPVSGNLDFISVSPGLDHTCGVTTTAKAYCWGEHYEGQLGIGEVGLRLRKVPHEVSGNLEFTMVTAIQWNSCGLTTNRKVYCWGHGGSGQLGNNTTMRSFVPVPVFGTER